MTNATIGATMTTTNNPIPTTPPPAPVPPVPDPNAILTTSNTNEDNSADGTSAAVGTNVTVEKPMDDLHEIVKQLRDQNAYLAEQLKQSNETNQSLNNQIADIVRNGSTTGANPNARPMIGSMAYEDAPTTWDELGRDAAKR